jgi:hypothetical protein
MSGMSRRSEARTVKIIRRPDRDGRRPRMDGAAALPPGKGGRGQYDDHRVVAREDEVDQDDPEKLETLSRSNYRWLLCSLDHGLGRPPVRAHGRAPYVYSVDDAISIIRCAEVSPVDDLRERLRASGLTPRAARAGSSIAPIEIIVCKVRSAGTLRSPGGSLLLLGIEPADGAAEAVSLGGEHDPLGDAGSRQWVSLGLGDAVHDDHEGAPALAAWGGVPPLIWARVSRSPRSVTTMRFQGCRCASCRSSGRRRGYRP